MSSRRAGALCSAGSSRCLETAGGVSEWRKQHLLSPCGATSPPPSSMSAEQRRLWESCLLICINRPREVGWLVQGHQQVNIVRMRTWLPPAQEPQPTPLLCSVSPPLPCGPHPLPRHKSLHGSHPAHLTILSSSFSLGSSDPTRGKYLFLKRPLWGCTDCSLCLVLPALPVPGFLILINPD